MPATLPACGKTAPDHSHRRTADKASEKVTPSLPGQRTAPNRCQGGKAWYSRATTVYSLNRQGAARSTVCPHQPRVVSKPRWACSSWNVVSIF